MKYDSKTVEIKIKRKTRTLKIACYYQTAFLSGNGQLYYGILNEKTAICMCIDPNSANNTLYLSSSHADAYIVNGDKNKVPLPASVDVTSSESQRSCIYLILVSTRRYQISGYFIAGLKNTSFSFPIQVASISPFHVTKKDEGKKYMKTYLGETVQFISRISNPIGSMLFRWDFGDGNVTQIERQDGTLTLSHAYEKAGCFFATNSWLFLSDNQTVERFSITLQIEALPSRSASDMLKGEENSLQNGTDSSNFREVLMKGRSIGYVGVMKKSLSSHSNETHTNGANVFEFFTLSMVLDSKSLIVHKHKFEVIVTSSPPKHLIYSFMTPLPNVVVVSSPMSNRATIQVWSSETSYVKVATTIPGSLGLSVVRKSLTIRPLQELSCFAVLYSKLVEPKVVVTVNLCGMKLEDINVKIECLGHVLFNERVTKRRFTVNILVSFHGPVFCNAVASIPGKPGVLQKYSARGVRTHDRQEVAIDFRITNFSIVFCFRGFRTMKPIFPKGHNVTMELKIAGASTLFEIEYLDKKANFPATWNETNRIFMAKYNMAYSGTDSYRLQIKARDPFSRNSKSFSVKYFDGKFAIL